MANISAQTFSIDSYFGSEYLPEKIENNHVFRERGIFQISWQKQLQQGINSGISLSYNELELKKAVELQEAFISFERGNHLFKAAIYPQKFGLESFIQNQAVKLPGFKKATFLEYDINGIIYQYFFNNLIYFLDFGGNEFNTFSMKSGIKFCSNYFNILGYFHANLRNQTYNDQEFSYGIDMNFNFESLDFKSSKLMRTFSKNTTKSEFLTFDEIIWNKKFFEMGANFKRITFLEKSESDDTYQLLAKLKVDKGYLAVIYSEMDFEKTFVDEYLKKSAILVGYQFAEFFKPALYFASNKYQDYRDNYEVGLQYSVAFTTNN